MNRLSNKQLAKGFNIAAIIAWISSMCIGLFLSKSSDWAVLGLALSVVAMICLFTYIHFDLKVRSGL